MTAKSHNHGWPIYWDEKIKKWRYKDTDEILDLKNPRPCKRCGKNASYEHPDPCLGHLPGVKGACCGHGAKSGYVLFENGVYIGGRLMNFEYLNAKEAHEFLHGEEE